LVNEMTLYGKVLKIFDETSLLVDIGYKDGLQRGSRLVVVETGEEIKDPDSGESLGRLEYSKAELVAVDVQEKISILKTHAKEQDKENVPLSTRMIWDSMRDSDTRVKMKVSHDVLSGIPSVSPVGIGDKVRVI